MIIKSVRLQAVIPSQFITLRHQMLDTEQHMSPCYAILRTIEPSKTITTVHVKSSVNRILIQSYILEYHMMSTSLNYSCTVA